MQKKYKQSNLSEADQKLRREMSRKDVAKAVGMPDEWDRQNIETIIKNYDRMYPGQIKALRDEARANHIETSSGIILSGKEANRRLVLTLPIPLLRDIEESYPAMFTSRDHFNWFCKNFKGILITGKH